MDALNANAHDLERDLDWFVEVIDARLQSYFRAAELTVAPTDIPPPPLGASRYADCVRELGLAPAERLVLLLALMPHVRPQLLDVLWSRNDVTERGYTEFGGVRGNTHGGFLPTGESSSPPASASSASTANVTRRRFGPLSRSRSRASRPMKSFLRQPTKRSRPASNAV
jgi:hypothetical protein